MHPSGIMLHATTCLQRFDGGRGHVRCFSLALRLSTTHVAVRGCRVERNVCVSSVHVWVVRWTDEPDGELKIGRIQNTPAPVSVSTVNELNQYSARLLPSTFSSLSLSGYSMLYLGSAGVERGGTRARTKEPNVIFSLENLLEALSGRVFVEINCLCWGNGVGTNTYACDARNFPSIRSSEYRSFPRDLPHGFPQDRTGEMQPPGPQPSIPACSRPSRRLVSGTADANPSLPHKIVNVRANKTRHIAPVLDGIHL